MHFKILREICYISIKKIIEIGAPGLVLEPFEVGTKNLKIFGIFQKRVRTERVINYEKIFFPPKIAKKWPVLF